VPLRKGAARSGFQLALEAHRLLLGRELDDDHQGPRAGLGGMSTGTVVVPLQPIADVARYADVVAIGFDVAPKDVDEALGGALHAAVKATLGPIHRGTIRPVHVGLRCASSSRLRGFCNAPGRATSRKLPSLGFARTEEGCRVGFEFRAVARLRPAFDHCARFGTGVGERWFGNSVCESLLGGPPPPRARSRGYGETDFARVSTRFECRWTCLPRRSSPVGRAKSGWEAGTRTPITWFRGVPRA
jgi:hypothetical protein